MSLLNAEVIDVAVEDVEVNGRPLRDDDEVPAGALVPMRPQNDQVAQLEARLAAMGAQLEARWKDEAEQRSKWKEQDMQWNARARIVAMMAAAIVGEGAAGTRPRPDQVATMAVEYADAVLMELRRKS